MLETALLLTGIQNTVDMSASERENETANESVTESEKGEKGTGSGTGGGQGRQTGSVRWKSIAETETRRNTDLAGMLCVCLCVWWAL